MRHPKESARQNAWCGPGRLAGAQPDDGVQCDSPESKKQTGKHRKKWPTGKKRMHEDPHTALSTESPASHKKGKNAGGAWLPFLLFLGFAQSSVTCYHGRAILASDAT